jgi:hypothetical protein
MFSADSAADARKLVNEIANFVSPTTAVPVMQKAVGSVQYINKDSTYQHFLRMRSTFSIAKITLDFRGTEQTHMSISFSVATQKI